MAGLQSGEGHKMTGSVVNMTDKQTTMSVSQMPPYALALSSKKLLLFFKKWPKEDSQL